MRQIEILKTIAEWEEVKEELPGLGLLVFKFSPRCPISRGVERDFDAWYNQLNDSLLFRCVKVDVVNSRELSRHIAQELSVQHESPQAIWLTPDLKVHWHNSHRAIRTSTLNAQLEALKK